MVTKMSNRLLSGYHLPVVTLVNHRIEEMKEHTTTTDSHTVAFTESLPAEQPERLHPTCKEQLQRQK